MIAWYTEDDDGSKWIFTGELPPYKEDGEWFLSEDAEKGSDFYHLNSDCEKDIIVLYKEYLENIELPADPKEVPIKLNFMICLA